MKRLKTPDLENGEEIVLFSQGGYANSCHSSWKLGHFYLTNKRLFFFQPIGVIFDAPFENILEVREAKRRYAFKEKEVIFVVYRHRKVDKILNAWIIVADLGTWKKKIYEKTSLVVDEEKIEKVLKELDPISQDILSYIWHNRHAKIDVLAKIAQVPTHMDVLLKIKEVINPVAEKIIGSPVLVFERLKIDGATGERVGFSWWIVGRRVKAEEKKTLVDIFDEGDNVNIIVELLGVQEENILVEVDKDKLIIQAQGEGRDYYEEVRLDTEVDVNSLDKRYKNGILQIRLKKFAQIFNQ